MQLVGNPKQDHTFNLLISNYAPTYTERVREYLSLLGISMSTDKSQDIILPVYFGIKKGKSNEIAISKRSTYDLIEILSAAIEIPTEHLNAGWVRIYPAMGPAGKDLSIHASKEKPKQASVAVKHHGYWFYIDQSDMDTKLFYAMVRKLWSVSIASTADQGAALVLTIPVGG